MDKTNAPLNNLDKHNALISAKMDFAFSGMFDPIKGTKVNRSSYKVRMHITPTVYAFVGEEFDLIEAYPKKSTRQRNLWVIDTSKTVSGEIDVV
jgi:hypothetical protein